MAYMEPRRGYRVFSYDHDTLNAQKLAGRSHKILNWANEIMCAWLKKFCTLYLAFPALKLFFNLIQFNVLIIVFFPKEYMTTKSEAEVKCRNTIDPRSHSWPPWAYIFIKIHYMPPILNFFSCTFSNEQKLHFVVYVFSFIVLWSCLLFFSVYYKT